jgi:hypothetical protein
MEIKYTVSALKSDKAIFQEFEKKYKAAGLGSISCDTCTGVLSSAINKYYLYLQQTKNKDMSKENLIIKNPNFWTVHKGKDITAANLTYDLAVEILAVAPGNKIYFDLVPKEKAQVQEVFATNDTGKLAYEEVTAKELKVYLEAKQVEFKSNASKTVLYDLYLAN